MATRNRELWWALGAILLVTLLYGVVVYRLGSVPAAQGFFGHSLGIAGFVLMLMTETLYSFRKRTRNAKWGRMARWLRFHIITGLVGPYMVLLHTAWKFNGLAGIVMLLTVIIVISGFIGRYIYTSVPRTSDEVELQARDISEEIQKISTEIALQTKVQPIGNLAANAFQAEGYRPVAMMEPVSIRVNQPIGAQTERLKQLEEQRRQLQTQMDSLAAARRLLATWHTIHIPIGVALFTAAFVHVMGALYYATLLH